VLARKKVPATIRRAATFFIISVGLLLRPGKPGDRTGLIPYRLDV